MTYDSVEDANKVKARKFRAGSKVIMSAQERQVFLRDSEYGKLVGVSHLFQKDKQ